MEKTHGKWFDFESEARTWRAQQVAPNEWILFKVDFPEELKERFPTRFYVGHESVVAATLQRVSTCGSVTITKI